MSSGRDYRLMFLAVAVFLMLPVALVEYLPLVDVPGHLARIQILKQYDQVPLFREVYEIPGKWIPHLTMDWTILELMRVMSLYQASRVFVALGMAVFALGCWTISRSVHGRITPFAVLALFLQYNSNFFFGLVAFQFGVGMALVTIGLWYRWRGQWSALRVVAIVALVLACYFTHLGGYMYLSVGIGWLSLRTWWAERRISASSLVGVLALIPPLVVYFTLGRSKGNVNQLIFSTPLMKLRAAGGLVLGYDAYVDIAVMLLLALAVLAAWKYGRFRFQPDFFSLSVVFAVLFLVMPWWLLTGSGADARMVLGVGVFLLLGLTCEISPATGKLIFAIALLAFVGRISFCGWVWTRQSDLMKGHMAFLDTIPQGAFVYPLVLLPDDLKANKFERVLVHVPDLAAVNRNAIVATTFAVAGQHMLVERTPRWYNKDVDLAHPESFEWDRVAKEYDTIWHYGRNAGVLAALNSRFTLTGQYGDARIYRTRK